MMTVRMIRTMMMMMTTAKVHFSFNCNKINFCNDAIIKVTLWQDGLRTRLGQLSLPSLLSTDWG